MTVYDTQPGGDKPPLEPPWIVRFLAEIASILMAIIGLLLLIYVAHWLLRAIGGFYQ